MGQLTVFGGHGFVGSEFVRQNPSVTANKRDSYIPDYPNILNFISTTHNYNVYDDSHLDIDTNLKVLVDILDTARFLYGKDVVFNQISSWFVYGPTDCPAREDSCCHPKGFYSITKHAAEQLLASYCETFEMNYRILRLSNVIGDGDKKISRKKNALQYMISEVAKGNDIDYLYQGESHRDYIE